MGGVGIKSTILDASEQLQYYRLMPSRLFVGVSVCLFVGLSDCLVFVRP